MSVFLKEVTTGIVEHKFMGLVYGPAGLGKTTLASNSDRAIFIPVEAGTNNLDVARFPKPKSWNEIVGMVTELITSDHNYKTVVIDSIDAAEALLFRHICDQYKSKSMELAAGGYGKAYAEAASAWDSILDLLDRLRNEKDMHVILIAHSQIVKFQDPHSQEAYDRYEMKLHRKSADRIREHVDIILFATWEVHVSNKDDKVKAYSDGVRVAYTERRPAWDAKNRYGLPLKIDLSWAALMEAMAKSKPNSLKAVRARLEGLVSVIQDPELLKMVTETIAKTGDNITQLAAIASRIELRLKEV